MELIIDKWEIIIALICALFCAITFVIDFYKLPYQKKLMNFREWLLFAVVEAEKKFGEKTGQLKLRYVYDLAVSKFAWLPKVLTFDEFALYVDDALGWMRLQLECNKSVKTYVEGENNE